MPNTKIASKSTASPKAAKKAQAPSLKRKRATDTTVTASPVIDAAVTQVVGAPNAKQKLIRDSFTIPKSEYVALENLKTRATLLTRPVKKSELLRAGIKALQQMSDEAFLAAMNDVPSLKTGRPKASGTGTAESVTSA